MGSDDRDRVTRSARGRCRRGPMGTESSVDVQARQSLLQIAHADGADMRAVVDVRAAVKLPANRLCQRC